MRDWCRLNPEFCKAEEVTVPKSLTKAAFNQNGFSSKSHFPFTLQLHPGSGENFLVLSAERVALAVTDSSNRRCQEIGSRMRTSNNFLRRCPWAVSQLASSQIRTLRKSQEAGMGGSQVWSSKVCSALGSICQKKPWDLLSMPGKASSFHQPLLGHKAALRRCPDSTQGPGVLTGP